MVECCSGRRWAPAAATWWSCPMQQTAAAVSSVATPVGSSTRPISYCSGCCWSILSTSLHGGGFRYNRRGIREQQRNDGHSMKGTSTPPAAAQRSWQLRYWLPGLLVAAVVLAWLLR